MVDDYTGHPADNAADRADADVPSGEVPSRDVPSRDVPSRDVPSAVVPGAVVPAGAPAVDQAYDTGSDAWIRAQVAAVTPTADDLPVVSLPVVSLPVVPLSVVPLPAVSVSGEPLTGEPLRVSLNPRLARRRPPRSPLRAVAGAAIAVAGVAVVIVALLVVQGDPQDSSPTVVAALDSAVAGRPSVAATSQPSRKAARPAAIPVPGAAVPGTPTAAAPAAPPVPAVAASPQVSSPLTVLNNSRVKGLAEQAAAQFRSEGWADIRLGNYTGRLPVTTLYFEPGQQSEAQRLAARFPGIERVLPRFDGLPGTGLTVVVTGDYRGDRST